MKNVHGIYRNSMANEACHISGNNCRSPDSLPGYFLWDLWWTKWQWDTVFPNIAVFISSVLCTRMSSEPEILRNSLSCHSYKRKENCGQWNMIETFNSIVRNFQCVFLCYRSQQKMSDVAQGLAFAPVVSIIQNTVQNLKYQHLRSV